MSHETAGTGGDPLGKRRFIRLPLSLPVIGRLPGWAGLEIRGISQRVGAGGLEVDFPQVIMPGSTLRVVLETRQGPIQEQCRVVFANKTATAVRHGLAFLETKDHNFAMDLFFRENL
jgi:hypothetical protein